MGTNSEFRSSVVSINSWYSNHDNADEEDFWTRVAKHMKYIDGTGSSRGEHRNRVGTSDDNIRLYKAPIMVTPSASFNRTGYKKQRKLKRQQEIDAVDKAGEGVEMELLKPTRHVQDGDSHSTSTYGSQLDVLRPATADLTSLSSANSVNVRFKKQPSVSTSTICSANTVLRMFDKKTSSWDECETKNRRRQSTLQQQLSLQQNLTNSKLEQNLLLQENLSEHHDFRENKDLRYFFQHPYSRLFISYFVIFCNFLLFAEDPVSHSRMESDISIVGNVFSFVLTKYPPHWTWATVKVLMWILAILCGMIFGKTVIHSCLCGRIFRLKMFRDDQGSWMTMFLTVIVSLYLFSHIYNLLLYLWYFDMNYIITSHMEVSNASVMKAAACSTWLGDLITALMVTDVMLQDNLYPKWAPWFRELWRRSNTPRILIFWVGSAIATAVVLTLIISDYISWDRLNHDFVATTELSRAFLASFILVMDLIIVMQDWDFPHFTTTHHVNLPGFSVATLKWNYGQVHFSGKWFNYGIIFCVMILDLNMWKNQIFYNPSQYGQYTGIDDKIRTVGDRKILEYGNATLWSWDARNQRDHKTAKPYFLEDMVMNSRYMGYPLSAKWTAFLPSVLGMILFITLITLYGRFPPTQNGTDRGMTNEHNIKSDDENTT